MASNYTLAEACYNGSIYQSKVSKYSLMLVKNSTWGIFFVNLNGMIFFAVACEFKVGQKKGRGVGRGGSQH